MTDDEPDQSRLVEVLWYLPRLECVEGAQQNEQHVERKGQQQMRGGRLAREHCLGSSRILNKPST